MKPLLHLYSTFFRIGAFTVGGGYVMLPLIQREVVDVRGWATNEEVLDYYAIGQSTPGIIAVNTATFIGYKTGGLCGAIAATAGMVSPSLILSDVLRRKPSRAWSGLRRLAIASVPIALSVILWLVARGSAGKGYRR